MDESKACHTDEELSVRECGGCLFCAHPEPDGFEGMGDFGFCKDADAFVLTAWDMREAWCGGESWLKG